ncbi:MAG: hypothetical protein HUU18_05985 [Phycisphaerales bacterium]|nr:hypothetical protein [Phycisphaerales bacterium]
MKRIRGIAAILFTTSCVALLGGCYEKEVRSSGLGSAGRAGSGDGNTYRTLGPKDSDPRPNRPRQDGW